MTAAYRTGVEHIMDQTVALVTDDIRLCFLRKTGASPYAIDQLHEFFSDLGSSPVGVNGGSAITDGIALTGKFLDQPVPGVFDAIDPLLADVASGLVLDSLAIYKNRGVGQEGASELVCYIDNFTIDPNGSDITVNFSNGVSRILRLCAL